MTTAKKRDVTDDLRDWEDREFAQVEKGAYPRPYLRGKLTISRPSSGDGRSVITLTVTDVTSGVEFFSAEMTPQQLMLALTGLAAQPLIYEPIPRVDLLGKQREVKSVLLDIGPSTIGKGPSPEQWEKIREHEVDGWEGSSILRDYANHHCWIRNKDSGKFIFRASYVRWATVVKEEEHAD